MRNLQRVHLIGIKFSYIKEPKLTKQNIEQAKTLLAKDGYTKEHPLKIKLITYDGRPELSENCASITIRC